MAVIQTGIGGRGLTRSPLPPVTIGNNRRRVCGIRGLGGLGWSGEGATQANCPNSQWNSNLNVCCAPGDGSVPAEADPCSILNNPNYLQAQAIDVGPLQANGVPISAGGNAGALELAEVVGYPQNVQQDAIDCWNNPGNTFVDAMGMTVNCPAAKFEQAPGIFVSSYTPGQLASMLAPTVTPKVITPGDQSNVLAANAPQVVSVTPAPATNVLSNSAAQTSGGSPVTQQQINNSQNVTGNSSNGQGGGAPAPASDVTVGGVDITAWITQNWVLLAAGAAALFILPGLMKGR